MSYVMSNPMFSIEETPTKRYAVYIDEGQHDCPDEYSAASVQTIRIARGLADISSSDGLSAEIAELLAGWEGNDQELDKAFENYFADKGLVSIVRDLRGYSQGEWAEVVIYGETKEDVESLYTDLDLWFKGEIYIVAEEEKLVYTASTGATIERWECVDSIGGVYLADYPKTIAEFKELF